MCETKQYVMVYDDEKMNKKVGKAYLHGFGSAAEKLPDGQVGQFPVAIVQFNTGEFNYVNLSSIKAIIREGLQL